MPLAIFVPMLARSFVVTSIVVILSACSVERADPHADLDTDTTANANVIQPSHRYGIRSGRLLAVSVRPGQTSRDTSIFMFDDYGRLERSEQDVDIPGANGTRKRTRTVVIRNDRTLYTLDVGRKVSRKTVLLQDGPDGDYIDFMRLSDKELKKYHVTRQHRDTVLGKPCDVFLIEDADNDMTGTYYVWMNIPLKIDITLRGARMSTTPIALEENIDINANMFEVPPTFRQLDAQ